MGNGVRMSKNNVLIMLVIATILLALVCINEHGAFVGLALTSIPYLVVHMIIGFHVVYKSIKVR